MDQLQSYVEPLRSLPVYFILTVAVVGLMMGVSHFLGQRHRDPETDEPYESGIVSTGTARLRISIQFYLIAVVFLIFDLETAFVLAWAVAFKQLGWAGYAEIAVFIGLLGTALLYLWRVGALDWRKKTAAARRRVP
jgi:NADH-quinone oxidoreductase subunit A